MSASNTESKNKNSYKNGATSVPDRISVVKEFTKNVTQKYLLALGLIAALTTAGYLGLFFVKKSYDTSAAVINISGRQRMLSQRIAIFAHDIFHESDKAKRDAARQNIKEIADLMEKSHGWLIYGNEELNLPGKPSRAVRNIYFSDPVQLDKRVRNFTAAARKVAAVGDDNLGYENSNMKLIEQEAHELLPLLNTLVSQYQKDTESRSRLFKVLTVLTYGAVMLSLAVVGFFILRPLTGRIEKEAAELAASENKLRDLTSTIGDGIIVTDEEGRLTFMNPEAERLLGWKENELHGKEIHSIIHKSVKDGQSCKAGECFPRKTIVSRETLRSSEEMFIRKDGGGFPVSFVVTPLLVEGAAQGAVIAFHDITEMKKTKAKLENQASLIQLLQDVAVASNEAATEAEAMITCIEKIRDFTGWEVGHVYIADALGVLRPTDIWSVSNPYRFARLREVTEAATFAPGVGLPGRVYETGTAVWINDVTQDSNFPRAKLAADISVRGAFAFPVLERKKVVAVMEFFTTVASEPNENLLEAVGNLATQIGRVTERKRAEENLVKLTKAIEKASEMVLITDPQGKIEYANPAAEEITGYKPEELLGENPRILKSGYHDKEFYRDIWDVITSGRVWRGEVVNRRKMGDLYHQELTISPVFDDTNALTHYVSIARDVSERKRYEKEIMRAKEVAESATKLKDKFVSLVAHDLRSPFNSMLGMLQLMEKQGAGAFNETQKSLMERVIGNGENMVKMIDRLLDISRLQSGKITLNRKFIDIHAAALVATRSLSYSAAEKGIRLVNAVEKGTSIYADFDLVCEVVKNLVSNSVKFCKEGDEVTVFIPEGEPAAVAVKDTGPGIPESIRENIFKHEVKTTMTGSAGEMGTGLGLPFCHDIIEAHGGEITVRSPANGGGSVFTVRLPAAEPLVLIIDDNDDDRRMLRDEIARFNVDILDVDDGLAALDLIRNKKPHLIISDNTMSHIDGLAILDAIKKDDDTSFIPVMFITSGMSSEARKRVLDRGAVGVYSKPVLNDEFIGKIEELLFYPVPQPERR